MEKQRVRQHLDAIAHDAGTDQRNLWPGIQQQLNRQRQPQEDMMANTTNVRPAMGRKTAAFILVPLLALLLTGTALSAPAVREFMQQRFGIVLFPASRPHVSSTERAVPLLQGGSANSLLSLEEAQQQVPFAIPQPGWLPEGLRLQGVWVGHGPAGGQTMEEVQANAPLQLELVYRPSADATQGVFLQITQGRLEGGYAFPSDYAEAVQVHGGPAVYIQGAWNEHGQWQPTANYSTLSWERDGLTYVVRTSELGISRDELVRLAESLR